MTEETLEFLPVKRSLRGEEILALIQIAKIVNGLKLSDLTDLGNLDHSEVHPLVNIGEIASLALNGSFVGGTFVGDEVNFIEDGATPTSEPDFIEDDETAAH